MIRLVIFVISLCIHITRAAVPVNTASSITFTDGDSDPDQIRGTITIQHAADQRDITQYVIYWGSNSNTKLNLIATLPKATGVVVYHFPTNTRVPSTATHLLCFSSNTDGEITSGVNTLITDLDLSANVNSLISPARPIAPHKTVLMNKNEFVIISLPGYDADGNTLITSIKTLPSVGKLYQLSQVYNNHNIKPIIGTEIMKTGTVVTGNGNKLIYKRPSDSRSSTSGYWSEFTYTVNDGYYTSKTGSITLLEDSNSHLVYSTFTDDKEGWVVSSNGAVGDSIKHQPIVKGLLNRFVTGSELEVNPALPMEQNGSTDDRLMWYFDAPKKFLGNKVLAYGGSITFTMYGSVGDFSETNLNNVRDLVVLYCDTCKSQTGIRLVYRINKESFNGNQKQFTVPLLEASWLEDSNSSLVDFTAPSQCEMVELLEGITSIKILGDHTKSQETVSIDDVTINSGIDVPLSCYSILEE